jgi:sulfatase maturation enzyme AslB (radical SAM superfamily)
MVGPTSTSYDFEKYKEKYVKLIVVNKKDLYQFDLFVDRLLKADTHEVKIIEDFSELDASNVSDDIVENTEDTMTLLDKYIDELDIMLDKKRLKNTMKSLYNEAQDLEL